MPKVNKVEIDKCGRCGAYHKTDYTGDCRSNFDRFTSWACERCFCNAELVVKTRFGFESVCKACARTLRKNNLILEERGEE